MTTSESKYLTEVCSKGLERLWTSNKGVESCLCLVPSLLLSISFCNSMHLSRFARLLSPVFGLAAFVVLLITFMTPALILKERSSLFVVKGSSTASKMVRRQYEPTIIPSTMRFSRVRRATTSAATESQSNDVQINIGMLGQCSNPKYPCGELRGEAQVLAMRSARRPIARRRHLRPFSWGCTVKRVCRRRHKQLSLISFHSCRPSRSSRSCWCCCRSFVRPLPAPHSIRKRLSRYNRFKRA